MTIWPRIYKRKHNSCLWETFSQDQRKSTTLGGVLTFIGTMYSAACNHHSSFRLIFHKNISVNSKRVMNGIYSPEKDPMSVECDVLLGQTISVKSLSCIFRWKEAYFGMHIICMCRSRNHPRYLFEYVTCCFELFSYFITVLIPTRLYSVCTYRSLRCMMCFLLICL